MAEKIRGANALRRRIDQPCIRDQVENMLNPQNEEVYAKKVEMLVDPAQETTETFSLGDYRSVQRRHDRFLGRRDTGGTGGDPLVVVENGGVRSLNLTPVIPSNFRQTCGLRSVRVLLDHDQLHNTPFHKP